MQKALNFPDQFDCKRLPGGETVLHRQWAETLGGVDGMRRLLREKPGRLLRKGGGQGETRVVDLDGNRFYVKSYKADRLMRWARDFVGSFRCVREWKANCRAEEAGISCAGVAGVIALRRGIFVDQIFVSEPAPGQSAQEHIDNLRDDQRALREYLQAAANHVAFLRARGFCHAHLSTDHVFSEGTSNFSLIDLERSRFLSPGSAECQERNGARFMRSLKKTLPPQEVRFFEEAYKEASGPTHPLPL